MRRITVYVVTNAKSEGEGMTKITNWDLDRDHRCECRKGDFQRM